MSDADAQCSFCNKPRVEVGALVAGPGVSICDECIALCNDIVREGEAAAAAAARPTRASDLDAALDALVVDHREAKRAFAAALAEQHLRLQIAGLPGRAPRILVAGPAGSGKTALGEALVELAAPNACCVDVGRFSESGYIGESVENAVRALLDRSGNPEQAAHGVLVLDGVEKLHAQHQGRDISGEGVQRELLPLLEGRVVEPLQRPNEATRPRLDTRNVLIVAIVRCEQGALPHNERDARAMLIERGLLAAFSARCDRVLVLSGLDAPAMARVLAHPRGPLEQANRALGARGPLRLTPQASELLAARAARSPDGAWALRAAVERLSEELLVSGAGPLFGEHEITRYLDGASA